MEESSLRVSYLLDFPSFRHRLFDFESGLFPAFYWPSRLILFAIWHFLFDHNIETERNNKPSWYFSAEFHFWLWRVWTEKWLFKTRSSTFTLLNFLSPHKNDISLKRNRGQRNHCSPFKFHFWLTNSQTY